MVVPIFISTQYKEAKDLDANSIAADDVDGAGNTLAGYNEDDEYREEDARDLKIRSVKPRVKSVWRSGWFLFCIFVLLCMIAVLSFLIGSYLSKMYGGKRGRTGWCKVEYSVEPFNRKAQHDFWYGPNRQMRPIARNELPKTDEWIRLKDGESWELESEGEFNYKIVTDLRSDMSALKFEDFIDGKNYCFIGSRYDFGLPSYNDVETFLESLHDKAEIMVDHVSEVLFLTAGDLLPANTYLEPSIKDLCGGPNTHRFSVAAINPDNDPEIHRVAQAEAYYYSTSTQVDLREWQELASIIATIQRLQEVLAYIPSEYIAEHHGGKVVSFEIVHPKSVLYLTGGSLTSYNYPVASYQQNTAQVEADK